MRAMSSSEPILSQSNASDGVSSSVQESAMTVALEGNGSSVSQCEGATIIVQLEKQPSGR